MAAQELITERIAITDAAFLNHDLPEAVAKLRQLGFQSIAIHHGGPQRGNFPTLGFDRANASRRQQAIDLMKSMKRISIHEKPGVPIAKQVARLCAAGDYAVKRGVRIGLENLRGPYFDFINLVKAVKHPAVGCTVDTGHIAYLDEVKSIEDPDRRTAAYNDYLEKDAASGEGQTVPHARP